MAHIVADRVRETTTTTGTGSITLAGAVAGFRAFGDVAANTDTVYYAIEHRTAAEWEVGLGTWATGGTLARTTVLASSNAGAAVNFTAGTKDVRLTAPAVAFNTGELTPAQIAADQNNYAPAGLDRASVLRLSSDRPNRAITGLTGGVPQRPIRVDNVGSFPIRLVAESASSTAANRFAFPSDVLLWPGSRGILQYDAIAQRWQDVGTWAAGNPWTQPVVIEDEFLSGGAEAGELGALGWGNSAAGTAVYTTVRSVGTAAGRLGLLDLQTGTTSGNNTRLHWGTTAVHLTVRAGDLPYQGWLLSIPTITTMSLRVGIGTDVSSATMGTDGAWIEFDSAASANWRANVRVGGVSGTFADSAVAVVANNWYLLEIYRISSTDVRFFLNGVQFGAFTSGIPADTVAMNLGLCVQTGAAAARNVVVDWFRARVNNLGQRWT